MANEPLSDSLIAAALAVCDRWDADDINDALMNRDIARLRHTAEAAHRVTSQP